MPENDQSETALLLRLGDLHVTNQFVTEQVPSQNITTEQIFDEMTLNLKNIAIEGYGAQITVQRLLMTSVIFVWYES